ncbi:MAG: DUF1972 domain-containing protein [Salinibacter sp.]|uniref:DUF1972 domain-containing protein n=1 Tax=Salinibacter sp. TaxID=2065818 RepID=UPI0035D4A3CE
MTTLFIVGSRGIPANYGGFETFAEAIATRLAARGRPVYVTCEHPLGQPQGPSTYRGVNLLHVTAPDNNLRTIVADVKALGRCWHLAEPGDVVYLLGYGVGGFGWPVLKALRAKGVRVWLNPDGIEWKRSRWSVWAQAYLRVSEWFVPRHVDRVICDSEAIEAHHLQSGGLDSAQTDVIEYGAPVVRRDDLSSAVIERRNEYLAQHGLSPGDYFIQVGRLVPENNLELMIRGILDDRVRRSLLIIANRDENEAFYRTLRRLVEAAGASHRVLFVGTIYDQPLLRAFRLGAFAHLHGHEVGGTNPALVEAMGLGTLILSLNTPFNREVLGEAGLFFGKSVESVVRTIRRAERLSDEAVQHYRWRAVERVRTWYNWERVTDKYEERVWETSTSPAGIRTPSASASVFQAD